MSTISLMESIPPLVLAIDLGTSSARTMIFDGRGRFVEGMESRAPYRMETTPGGGVEIDADELVEIIFSTIDDLLIGASSPLLSSEMKVAGVAISTFWHNLIGVDSGGRAVTPVYSWNDNRAANVVEQIRGEIDE